MLSLSFSQFDPKATFIRCQNAEPKAILSPSIRRIRASTICRIRYGDRHEAEEVHCSAGWRHGMAARGAGAAGRACPADRYALGIFRSADAAAGRGVRRSIAAAGLEAGSV